MRHPVSIQRPIRFRILRKNLIHRRHRVLQVLQWIGDSVNDAIGYLLGFRGGVAHNGKFNLASAV